MKKISMIFLLMLSMPFFMQTMDNQDACAKITSCCLLIPYVAAETAQVNQKNTSEHGGSTHCPALCCLATCCFMVHSIHTFDRKIQKIPAYKTELKKK